MEDVKFARQAPVRVSVPASVAADLGSLQQVVEGVLKRFGCPACCSGRDLYLEIQRDVLVAKDLARAEVSLSNFPSRAKVDRVPTARIGMSPEASYDIGLVKETLAQMADISGHSACATGCDILLELESIYVVNQAQEIQERLTSYARY